MNVYQHVAELVDNVHGGLLDWADDRLVDAGLRDAMGVVSEFPTEGQSEGCVVLVPYRIGPDPKLVDMAPGLNLVAPPADVRRFADRVSREWLEAGSALHDAICAIEQLCGTAGGLVPLPVAEWYRRQGGVWTAGGALGPVPVLWWTPGVALSVRYLAVGVEPAVGTRPTRTRAPAALRALSALAAAVHLQREIRVEVPGPVDAGIDALFDAFVAGLCSLDQPSLAEALERAAAATRRKETLTLAILPVHDLTNQDLALLMQSMRQPLRVALNLEVRCVVGGHPRLEPGARWVGANIRPTGGASSSDRLVLGHTRVP